jgi:predicted metal-dependent phosphoesterase TrpH
MKIDLQIHTTFSDGHNSPKEIAELAHNAGVGMLSATEHDNISSFKELEKECAKY